MRRLGFILTVITALSLAPSAAFAGGFEYAAGGTRALGRGGAYFARSDDPLAILYNPANLSAADGVNIQLDLNLSLFSACVTRAGLYPSGGGTNFGDYADLPYPEVCNEGPPGPSPYIGVSAELTDTIGVAAGLVTPAATGTLIYGDEETSGVDVGGQTFPTPTRYMLTKQELFLLYPSVAIGWSPIPELRVGATFTWGMAIFNYDNFVVPVAGENPATDIKGELSVQDLFVPGAIVSVQVLPTDWLEITAGFRINDVARASGDIVLTYGALGNGEDTKPTRNEYSNVELDAPIPWSAWAGFRYANRRHPRSDAQTLADAHGIVDDAMRNEVFDIELDVIWENSGRVDEFQVRPPPGSVLNATDVIGGSDFPTTYALPAQIHVPHGWHDQIALRLGGDWNVIPSKLALRVGASFETSGVDPELHGMDFYPDQRFGAHVGATMRFGRFDLSVAYAHLFNETVTTAEGEGRFPQISADEMGEFVNSGTYRSHYDVFSLGGQYHF